MFARCERATLFSSQYKSLLFVVTQALQESGNPQVVFEHFGSRPDSPCTYAPMIGPLPEKLLPALSDTFRYAEAIRAKLIIVDWENERHNTPQSIQAALERLSADIPVIVIMSDRQSDQDLQACIEAGATHVIKTPAPFTDYIDIFRKTTGTGNLPQPALLHTEVAA